jgi:hypothetical protein
MVLLRDAVVVDSVVVVVVVEPLAPIVLPLVLVSVLLEPPAAVLGVLLEPPAAVLGVLLEPPAAVLGVLLVPPVVPEAELPPGVPVLPIGVVCVLCCPAPVAGSFEVVLGGVL